MVGNHQTSIYRWLFGVPGTNGPFLRWHVEKSGVWEELMLIRRTSNSTVSLTRIARSFTSCSKKAKQIRWASLTDKGNVQKPLQLMQWQPWSYQLPLNHWPKHLHYGKKHAKQTPQSQALWKACKTGTTIKIRNPFTHPHAPLLVP